MNLPRWLPIRPTVRLQLTALYTLLFVGAGAILLGLTYVLLQRALQRRLVIVHSSVLGGANPTPLPHVAVQLRQAQQLKDAILHDLLVESAIALAIATVVAVVLGWVMAGRVLRPVHQITATARRLSEATLDERIAMQGPKDEMRELADTFDAMLDRLKAAFDSQHRFVANASHELRTPLAVQRTLIDVSLRDREAGPEELRSTMQRLRQVVDASDHLIESLLVLAR
jgi:signal transduction histidine kinase